MPLELKIIVFGFPVAWFVLMYLDWRAEQKRKKRHQRDLNESFKKAKLTLVKK